MPAIARIDFVDRIVWETPPRRTSRLSSMVSQPYLKTRNTLAGAVLLGMVATIVVLQFDEGISSSMRTDGLPGDLRKAVNLAEVFAHGFGVAAILGSVLVVAVERRRAVWGAIIITAVAGITANVAKQAIVRVRPNSQGLIQVVDIGIAETAISGERELDATIEAVEPSFWDSRQRSFPSGHAATACGLAIGLSLVFPRGAWLFAVFAILSCVQRVVSGAHFPSDVFAGASIAFLVAAIALSIPKVRRAILAPTQQ